MLTANEARKIVELSDASVAVHIEKIDAIIKEAAEKGLRTIELRHDEKLYINLTKSTFTRPKPDALQQRIINELKNHGFSASWDDDGPMRDKPMFGVYDDNHVPEQEQNYLIKVRW